jgi:uncharacterized protein (DUF1501 family)
MNKSRREFLDLMSSYASLGAAASVGIGLGAASNAAAQTTDYKALVCVFLYGAMDCHNTLIPMETNRYNIYGAARPLLAVPMVDLREIVPIGVAAGLRYALPKELAPLKSMFDAGSAAVVCNMGPLVEPTTRTSFLARSVALPPRLFSHNDQQAVTMSSSPEGPGAGWGGQLADLLMSQNANSTFTCVTPASNAIFLSGLRSQQYQVGLNGPIPIRAIVDASLLGNPNGSVLMNRIVDRHRGGLLEIDHGGVSRRSIGAEATLSAALVAGPSLPLPTQLSSNPLAAQLNIVARMISVRGALGMKRQVFLVGMGGFDTHAAQNEELPPLHTMVADAIAYFHGAVASFGDSNRVTSFTASDFGRALVNNGSGSDHGWGGHHFVCGGAVNGRRLYGDFPDLSKAAAQDGGNGRLVPTVSVSQFGATLGKWFGVSDSDLLSIFPTLNNFTVRNLGFMKSA